MPKFSKEVNVDIDVDADIHLSIEEFYEELDSEEKRELFELLIEESKDSCLILYETRNRGFDAAEFEKSMHKLVNNYDQLTAEETKTISELAKRF